MTRLQLQEALEEIFAMKRGSLRETDSRQTVEAWSSIADVQIVTLLASECGLDADTEVLEAETFGDLLRVLETRRALSS